VGLESAHRYLARCGYELPGEDLAEYVQRVLPERWEGAAQGGANLRLADLLREVWARYGAQPSDTEIERAVALYIAPLDQEVRPYEDAESTLALLRERGYTIGLISNTMWPSAYHLDEMQRFGLLPHFSHTLFSADAGLWKPQPGAYRRALEALGAAPEEAVFVGDIPQHDVLGAQRAGLRGVYRRTEGRDMNGVVPDAEIGRLSELPAVVDSWS